MTQQKATLSGEQTKAIYALAIGGSVTSVAEEVGVHRSTMHRWLNDLDFKAELNLQRKEIELALTAHTQTLAQKAMVVLDEALEEGDRSVAIAVARGAGVLNGKRQTVGSATSAGLELDAMFLSERDGPLAGLR